MSAWDRFVETFFNAKVMLKYYPDILSGVVVTIELAVLIIVSGLLAGLALALLRALGIRPLNWLIIFVVDLFRSLPPLVVIVLIYFGLPSAGVSPSAFVSTWLSLALVLMAFAGGIGALERWREMLVGKTLTEALGDDADGDQMDALLRPVLGGEPRDFEWVGRRSGIHLSVQAVAVRDPRAGVIGVMAVCRDVTPRHEVEAALRSSRGLPTGAPARAR